MMESSKKLRITNGAMSSAFTLVELLVVIAIVVALMAIVVPSYQAIAGQHRRATCAANLKALGRALALFREDYQSFPPDSTEYLWTPEAVEEYRNIYGVNPPGDYSVGTLVGAAYHPDGRPFVTHRKGLGLFTLYYVGAYATQLPPLTSEPWIRDYPEYPGTTLEKLRTNLEMQRRGLNGLAWFRGSGYITEMSFYHCIANPAELEEGDLVSRGLLPELRGWNNYDRFYRRNFWGNEHGGGAPTEWSRALYGRRDLFHPYPPADTVVTWCPCHRSSSPPSGPGVESLPNPGDQEIVLFIDGTVRRMASQQMNRMYQEPSPGAGWPEGPIM